MMGEAGDHIPMPQPHATLLRFGYPATCLVEWEHWAALLRPQQVTLGALVLASRHDVTSLAALPDGAYAELQTATKTIETGLRTFRPFDKINYLCLMMVDPQVHFHVLPRYSSEQVFADTPFKDTGWPGLPDLKFANELSQTVREALHRTLVDAFNATR